jgi:hydrogenase-4 component E
VIATLLPHALLVVVAVGVYALTSRQLERTVKAFAVQSYALAVVAMMAAPQSEHPRHLWVLAALTVAVKGIAVPIALSGAVRRLRIRHEIEFIVNIPSSLLIAAIGTLGAFALTGRIFGDAIATLRGAAGAGMATVLVGLLVMLGRRKVITQIIGLLIMENGVILCALGLTLGMPLIVEIGVALDVLVAVQILALFAYRVGAGLEPSPRDGDDADTGADEPGEPAP